MKIIMQIHFETVKDAMLYFKTSLITLKKNIL